MWEYYSKPFPTLNLNAHFSINNSEGNKTNLTIFCKPHVWTVKSVNLVKGDKMTDKLQVRICAISLTVSYYNLLKPKRLLV